MSARREPTPTELLVLKGLAAGHTISYLAHRMGVTRSAVQMRSHRAAKAMGARSTEQAIYEATRRGLLDEVPRP